MLHDPSFPYVKLMMKPPPDYEGNTFRVSPRKRHPPIAPFGVERVDGGSGTGSGCTKPTAPTTSTLNTSSGPTAINRPVRLASPIHHQNNQIAVLSKPNWSVKRVSIYTSKAVRSNTSKTSVVSYAGTGLASLSTSDLRQAEIGTGAITFDIDVATHRLYLRILTKHKANDKNSDRKNVTVLSGESNKDDKNVWGNPSPHLWHDRVEVSMLLEVFPSMWDDFYPGN